MGYKITALEPLDSFEVCIRRVMMVKPVESEGNNSTILENIQLQNLKSALCLSVSTNLDLVLEECVGTDANQITNSPTVVCDDKRFGISAGNKKKVYCQGGTPKDYNVD